MRGSLLGVAEAGREPLGSREVAAVSESPLHGSDDSGWILA